MGKQEDEIRRLQRLRDEQLRSRDPTAKDRATQQRLSARHRGSRKRITAKSVIRDFPFKWRLMVIGGIIGIVVAVIINLVMPNDPTIRVVGIILVVFGFVAGRVMGAIRDWGDEGWGAKH